MNKKILVVDDEPIIREMIRNRLEADGYDVGEVESGEKAIAYFNEHRPAIVITDLNMPGMNGEEVVQILKKVSPSVITIVLTAYGTVESTIKMMQSGCDDYLIKPLEDLKLLTLAIEKSLQRKLLRESILVEKKLSHAKSRLLQVMVDDLVSPTHSMVETTRLIESAISGENLMEARTLLRHLLDTVETLESNLGHTADKVDRLIQMEKNALEARFGPVNNS